MLSNNLLLVKNVTFATNQDTIRYNVIYSDQNSK